jgi:hypothetical protein
LLSFALSSTLDIESSNIIYFLYHAMGFALGHSCKSLLLMYMYTKLSTQFDVNQFRTSLWTNEYEPNNVCTMMQNTLAPKCDK